MSEPARYKVEELNCCFDADMIESPDGEYVLHSDYAKLKAEVERLTDALNKLVKTPLEADGVQVKVNFWTKYGSRLPSSYETFWENAAKEGKPSV